jgi:hypothetical protein
MGRGARRYLAAAVLGAVLAATPGAAVAQELGFGVAPGGGRHDLGRRQRVRAAVAGTTMAGATLVAALITYGVAARGTEACGLTGCFIHPSDSGKLAAGALGAAGITMALVTLPALFDALWVDRRPPRRPALMGWGLSLTAAGAGIAAANVVIAVALARADRNANTSPFDTFPFGSRNTLPGAVDRDVIPPLIIAQSVVAAANLGIGIPLWAAGGRSQDPAGVRLVPAGNGMALQASF